MKWECIEVWHIIITRLVAYFSDGESVILFPQYEELKNEVHKLRTELSMLVLERDELQLVECKNIEMAYLLALGGWITKQMFLNPEFHKIDCLKLFIISGLRVFLA